MIKYYNRDSTKYEIEKVAGEKYLNWLYSSPMGMGLLESFVKRKAFSKLYGIYCDTNVSTKKIENFISELDIDMSKYEKSLKEFSSFNDFFTRNLKDTSLNKTYIDEANILISPCDGKILAYENLNKNTILNIKGFNYDIEELIHNKKISLKYTEGTCLIFRLCPTDYHRFHFIDNGICTPSTKIHGKYYSVNPIALEKVKKIFCENKREWSILKSENFNDVLYLEVGATCVGSIIQTYKSDVPVKKGTEKGYFKFGGSTVILFFKKDMVNIDEDILTQTKLGFETNIHIGEKIGVKKVMQNFK